MVVSAKPLTSSRFKRRETQRSSSFRKFRTVHLGLRITVPRVLPRLRFSLLPQQFLEFLPSSGFFAYLYHICCSFNVICPFKIHHTPRANDVPYRLTSNVRRNGRFIHVYTTFNVCDVQQSIATDSTEKIILFYLY